ncbi:MAG: CoA pyrophosphatase [Lachnospiraceae bacterium]|nr:CoA pyrophosphatase [Lachnospiraceae bacterium]
MNFKNLNPEDIKKAFDNHIPSPEGVHRNNSIMATLIEIDGKLHFLYTKRALTMKHQPGDVCFPGGRQEDGETAMEAAIRETEEELGISRENITVLGESDFIVTMFNTKVTPFVGLLTDITLDELKPNPGEVDKIFAVPVDFFRETEPIKTELSLKQDFPEDFPIDLIYNGRNYPWGKAYVPQLFYVYEGETIWGLTARITNNICEIIEKNNDLG